MATKLTALEEDNGGSGGSTQACCRSCRWPLPSKWKSNYTKRGPVIVGQDKVVTV